LLISNWGNYPKINANVRYVRDLGELKEYIRAFEHLIPRGLGRCYGDSSLSDNIVSICNLNRFLSFDEKNGVLRCESGVSLKEVLDIIVLKGWFLPVTPGTKFITVGGAIASDVHGKNHHKEGSFADHLLSIELMLSNGEIDTCSKEENSELFSATCGGMGLTGIILNATFKLKRIETAYIRQRIIIARDINEIIGFFDEYKDYTYSVAWIDCLAKGKNLGRSVLMLGEHAKKDEITHEQFIMKEKRKVNIPFNLPSFVLNRVLVRVFNAYFFNKHIFASKKFFVDYDEFFYPLDSIFNWNRIYGSRGFIQYQFVLPKKSGAEGLKRMLEKVSQRGTGSFLAVLKLFGKGNNNLLSFPMEGYTLALDFPLRNGLLEFLDELDEMVLEYGGRLYLSKDARMSSKMFKGSYKKAIEFTDIKHRLDKENRLSSLQSRRLGF
jgi:decaprenylphospho-beta-D-ribofuranose 2-oxidase